MTFNDIFKSGFLESVSSFSVTDTIIGLLFSLVVGLFIFVIYKKTLTGVMYSTGFALTLVGMSMVTTLVIMAVTSNVVLSLGMVGALSIVRFRTAVKDPMDTAYMFWALTMGILLGAKLYPIALAVAAAMLVMLAVDKYVREKRTAVRVAALAAAVIIVGYTFLGGFNAVCWTDFFQGMLMLAALMLTPILALFVMKGADFVAPVMAVPENYYNALSGGGFNWKSMSDILSGLGWGLGYFGMPHILVRYLSIKSEHEMRKSQIIGCSWIVLILAMSAVVGLIGRQFLGEIDNENLVFVHMVRRLFPAFISGVLLSAILAAAMSTADSQLLASSSAFASDIYKPVIRKDATDHEMQWAGRIIVILISIVAYFIAADPNCGGIMALVECAWAGFGSAFGPVILLSLYWRRLTYSGAIAGVCVGFVVDAVWYAFLSSSTGLYEIIPGFLCGLLAAVIVSLCSKAPSKEVTDLFDRAFEPTD